MLAVLELLPRFRNLRAARLQLPGHLCMPALLALRHTSQLEDLTLGYIFFYCESDNLFKSASDMMLLSLFNDILTIRTLSTSIFNTKLSKS